MFRVWETRVARQTRLTQNQVVETSCWFESNQVVTRLRCFVAERECDRIRDMTKLLDKAIAKARELPAEDQDAVAVAMLAMTEETPIVALDEETRAAIREGLEQARRGEVVPDEEIDALWRRHGL